MRDSEPISTTSTATSPRPRRRRWYQFSLRTLAVFVTFWCIAFGWLGYQLKYARSQRNAAETLRRFKGDVVYDYEMPPNGYATWYFGWMTDLARSDLFSSVAVASVDMDDLIGQESIRGPFDRSIWAALPKLQELSLRTLREADSQFVESFPNFAGVQRLFLFDCSDARMPILRHFKHVRTLALSGDSLTDAGIEEVANCTELEELSLVSSGVTSHGLARLEKLPRLRWLALSSDKEIRDDGLDVLRSLPRIESLEIDGTSITPAGLSRLKSLPRLHCVRLDIDMISDESIAQLRALPALEKIEIPMWWILADRADEELDARRDRNLHRLTQMLPNGAVVVVQRPPPGSRRRD
jgi:hypothetical protein